MISDLNPEKIRQDRDAVNRRIDDIISNGDILMFFSNYVSWNSVFAGCVSNLSSRFHLWPELDEDEGLGLHDWKLFDAVHKVKTRKSHIIAGQIFAAATDEYDEQGCKVKDERVTHKDMAWHFLTSLYDISGQNVRNRKVLPYTKQANRRVMEGYGVNAPTKFTSLVKNLGFHMGSENLAALEFSALDKAMKKHHPGIYEQLEYRTLADGITGADWIKVHGTVEEEHFRNALKGAEVIVDSIVEYSSPNWRNTTTNLIEEGYREFSWMQDKFFYYNWGMK